MCSLSLCIAFLTLNDVVLSEIMNPVCSSIEVCCLLLHLPREDWCSHHIQQMPRRGDWEQDPTNDASLQMPPCVKLQSSKLLAKGELRKQNLTHFTKINLTRNSFWQLANSWHIIAYSWLSIQSLQYFGNQIFVGLS